MANITRIFREDFTSDEIDIARRVLESIEAGACHAKECDDDDVYVFAASVEEVCVQRTRIQLEDYVTRSQTESWGVKEG